MEIISKKCGICKIDKLFTDFIKNKKCSFGINNKCKICQQEYRKQYNKSNKEKILKYNIQYNKSYNKEWGKNNKHIVKWRGMLNRCLIYKGKKKNGKTEKTLGYSIEVFKKHIEYQFINNMGWNNIHIDHKIPLTWFKPETPVNVINNLFNLQPKLAGDNISKLNRYSDNISLEYFVLIKEWILEDYLPKIEYK
jgi:hypothetical protein